MRLSKIKNIGLVKYIVIFLLIVSIYCFFGFGISYGDPLANYGFSYAIAKGQVPYLDFNTISTPLFAFYSAIGLLFWNNYLVFILEFALLVTITFFFLDKLYGKKSYLILAFLIGLNFYGILATYNFMCFSMLIIILYLEEKHCDKDYLIGFFIGLAILSKHTVGCFFILPTVIYYFGDLKKIMRRVLGCLIPCSIFLVYLIINKALFSFIDLCFLGLLDFSTSNGKPFSLIFYFSILLLFLAFYLIYKDRKDIKNLYLVFTFFFTVPLFDYCHFPLFFCSILMMLFPYFNWLMFYNIFFSFIIIFLALISSFRVALSYNPVFTSKFRHFEYYVHARDNYEKLLKINDFLNSYDDAVVLSYFNMQYKIINNRKLDYFDVMLYGNFGYDGVNKMINRLKDMEKQIFIVCMDDYSSTYEYSQFAKKVVDYVLLNGIKIDSKYGYNVYYVE